MAITKVSAGQKLRIPAEAYNAFVDAADAFKAQSHQQQVDRNGVPLPSGVALVRNDSGTDLDRFALLGLDVPLITPTDNLASFHEHLTFSGVSPDDKQHANRFCVLQEPIAAGAIGRALVIGVTPVHLDVQTDTDEMASVVADETGSLKTGSDGGARILWKEAGTGIVWGLIQIPAGGSGGGSPNLVLTVTAANHGWMLADVLRWSGTAWELADPAVVGATDTLGVVGKIPDDNTALVVLWGLLCLEGFQDHADYWLDPTVPGGLTKTKPTEKARLVLHHAENHLCVVKAGGSGEGGSATRFADLTDVDVTTTPPVHHQVPIWDATAKRWTPHDVVLADPVPANQILAGPKIGADAKPTLRAMVLEDLPELQPCSVVANATAMALPPTALSALADDRALLRVGGTLQWLQITTAIVADGAVTTAKIAPKAVDTTALADAAVTTAKLADAAITDAKIVSLSWGKLIGVPGAFPPSPHTHPLGGALSGTTDAAQIAPGAVTTAALADGAVTAAKLAAMNGPAVIGRSDATLGVPTIIPAVTEGGVLRRQGGSLAFALISDSQIDPAAGIAWSKISTVGSHPADVGAAPAIHTHAIASLSDVAITAPTVGQVLTYDAVRGRWVNDAPTGGPGTMRPLSVWVNPTAANADGTDLVASADNRALSRVAGSLAWLPVNRATLSDGIAYSVMGRSTSTSGPVADLAAGPNTVLRRGANGDLGFGRVVSAQIDSGVTDDGWVLTTGPVGQLLWTRTITLGKGAGTSASIQGALVVVISSTGDYAKISSAGIELYRPSVNASAPLVTLDLNAYATWTPDKAMGIREIDICDRGTARKMLVLASAPF